MSQNACNELGIDSKLYRRACDAGHNADVKGFGRIYISGLQVLVSKLDGKIEVLRARLESEEELKCVYKTQAKEAEKRCTFLEQQKEVLEQQIQDMMMSRETW